MSKLYAIQEARIRAPGAAGSQALATYWTEFTAANDATWVSGAGSPVTYKLRHIKGPVDVSGLEHKRADSPVVRTRGRGRAVGIKERDSGSVKLSMFLNSTLASSEILTLMKSAFGGLATPSAEHATLDNAGSHTTSKLYSTGIGAKGIAAGQSVLCGIRGDGRGNGEVIPVVTVATDYVQLARATKDTMQDADVVWLSHTVYPDMDVAREYFELLLIGDDATAPSQINLIGCSVTSVELTETSQADGEMPTVVFTITPARWRTEPAATKATISQTVGVGADPVGWVGGGMWVATTFNATASTRGYMLGGKFEFDPKLEVAPLLDPSGYAGIGGHRMKPSAATWKFVAYANEGTIEPIPTMQTEYELDAGIGYQVLRQWGNAADGCFAVALDRAHLDREPYQTELNGCLAYTLEGHTEERATTTDLLAADVKLHFFHS